MGEYVDKPPFISPDEPWGPCDWLDSCWAPASDWRRDPQVDHFVPVCPEHSQAARIATLEAEVERLRVALEEIEIAARVQSDTRFWNIADTAAIALGGSQ